jgi:hypothetical protein
MCDELLELIRKDPGHSRSHYERMPVAKGGVKASQDRKERAMTSMINDGSVVRVELEAPKGRANHYVRVDEDVDIEPNSAITYKWVVAVVDLEQYVKTMERNKTITDAVAVAYKDNLRRSFAQQILSVMPEDKRLALEQLTKGKA